MVISNIIENYVILCAIFNLKSGNIIYKIIISYIIVLLTNYLHTYFNTRNLLYKINF